ncbi:Interleukin-17D [Galemys pyrenaicus]|uniref:Interleukin-17D n=1 Tax=Galemys pyrenaicus TaxID=202257 RepID=A0A8J6ANK7_GALPY|nr:Interleukin-17D [Galemys pyrenaicus]
MFSETTLGSLVWVLVAGVLLALPPGADALRAGRRPARPRGCADRPEELLEQLYGRLAAGVLGAFHHTLQLGPREQARNASCPAGGRPDRRFRPPTNLRSVAPWAYRRPVEVLMCKSADTARGPVVVPMRLGMEVSDAHSESKGVVGLGGKEAEREISYDPARYPKYLPEAYCLCRGCLTGLFGEEDFHFRSTPVYMPTVILRRTAACAGGRSVYAEEYVTIPVGCTCVPEPEKDTDSINSSMDKQGAKHPLHPSTKPGQP